MKFIKSKKGLALLATLAVAAVAAFGAYAYFTNSGNATDPNAVSVGSVASPWSVTFDAATYAGDGCPTCKLEPTAAADPNKVVATVPFHITNTEESDQHLTTWTAEIPSTWSASLVGHPDCTAADFSVGGEATPGDAHTVSGLTVTLKPASDSPDNTYDSSVTVQMIDNGADQDACQGATPDLKVSASS